MNRRTGYLGAKESLKNLLPVDVIENTADIWGLDAEDEVNGVYRLSGYPGVCYYFISRL